jgi:hypothetical protein
VGAHTISYHKDFLGWIPSAQKYVATPGSNQTIVLERLGQPVSSSNYLMAQIPIGGSTIRFYTVEARRFTGYDSQIPGEAVVIHQVDTTRSDRLAQVVDVDNNGDPNDAGAMWTPGETFTDLANGITVSVNAATTTGFEVTILSDDTTPPSNVQVTAPSSGQTVSGTFALKGTAQDNSGTIQKMEFYIDTDSTPVCSDATAKPSGSTFTCNWDTTTKPNGSHTVKAKAYDPAGNSAFSAAVSFTVTQHTLTVTSGPSGTPNPVASGGTASLSVSATDSLAHSLSYAWTASCPVALGSNGSFSNPAAQNPSWTAPTNTTGSQQNCTAQVTVSDGQGLSQLGSYSQGVLPSSITVLTPNGGETWAIGTTQTIRWTSSGVSGNVKIEVSRNGGASWATLFSSTTNDGVQTWKVSKPATTQARIRVSSVKNPSVADTSNANFTIKIKATL